MKELYEKYAGKKGEIITNGLRVEVTITDVKLSYGRERYQVKPVAGEGEVWVESVTLKD